MKNLFQAKNDYIKFLRDMILPLAPYYSEGKAELKFGTLTSAASKKAQLTEAFLRPLWGLAPLWGCSGECSDFNEIYRRGIINGTNPDHPEPMTVKAMKYSVLKGKTTMKTTFSFKKH